MARPIRVRFGALGGRNTPLLHETYRDCGKIAFGGAVRVSQYLTQQLAQQIDQELMAPDKGGFALEQLMELAGLGCAQALYHLYGPTRMLICCGVQLLCMQRRVRCRGLTTWL